MRVNEILYRIQKMYFTKSKIFLIKQTFLLLWNSEKYIEIKVKTSMQTRIKIITHR